jgi:hypothetical protein
VERGLVSVTESNRVDEKPFENDLRSRKLETNLYRVLIYIAIKLFMEFMNVVTYYQLLNVLPVYC